MRWRRRRLRASVNLQHGDRPVVLCLGPGLTFELNVTESRQLAGDLADAIVKLQDSGGSG
jgi:hypothetical protein